MRPYLVFVRAGPKSFHSQHIREDPERNWDCCVSWYSNPGYDGGAERSTSGVWICTVVGSRGPRGRLVSLTTDKIMMGRNY